MDFEKQVKPAWLLYVESIDVDDVPDVPDVPEEEETPEPPMPKGQAEVQKARGAASTWTAEGTKIKLDPDEGKQIWKSAFEIRREEKKRKMRLRLVLYVAECEEIFKEMDGHKDVLPKDPHPFDATYERTFGNGQTHVPGRKKRRQLKNLHHPGAIKVLMPLAAAALAVKKQEKKEYVIVSDSDDDDEGSRNMPKLLAPQARAAAARQAWLSEVDNIEHELDRINEQFESYKKQKHIGNTTTVGTATATTTTAVAQPSVPVKVKSGVSFVGSMIEMLGFLALLLLRPTVASTSTIYIDAVSLRTLPAYTSATEQVFVAIPDNIAIGEENGRIVFQFSWNGALKNTGTTSFTCCGPVYRNANIQDGLYVNATMTYSNEIIDTHSYATYKSFLDAASDADRASTLFALNAADGIFALPRKGTTTPSLQNTPGEAKVRVCSYESYRGETPSVAACVDAAFNLYESSGPAIASLLEVTSVPASADGIKVELSWPHTPTTANKWNTEKFIIFYAVTSNIQSASPNWAAEKTATRARLQRWMNNFPNHKCGTICQANWGKGPSGQPAISTTVTSFNCVYDVAAMHKRMATYANWGSTPGSPLGDQYNYNGIKEGLSLPFVAKQSGQSTSDWLKSNYATTPDPTSYMWSNNASGFCLNLDPENATGDTYVDGVFEHQILLGAGTCSSNSSYKDCGGLFSSVVFQGGRQAYFAVLPVFSVRYFGASYTSGSKLIYGASFSNIAEASLVGLPLLVTITNIQVASSTSITVSWNPVDLSGAVNGTVTVECTDFSSTPRYIPSNPLERYFVGTTDEAARSITLVRPNQLVLGVGYSCRAFAANEAGSGTKSDSTNFQFVSVPSKPVNDPSLTPTSETQIEVKLIIENNAPRNGGSLLTSLRLENSVDGSSWTSIRNFSNINDPGCTWSTTGLITCTYTMGGLVANNVYYARYRAENAEGFGPFSAVTNITLPPAPRINDLSLSSSNLVVTAGVAQATNTSGGAVLTLTGSNFKTFGAVSVLMDRCCGLAALPLTVNPSLTTDSKVVFVLPASVGTGLNFIVKSGAVSSAPSSDSVSYPQPTYTDNSLRRPGSLPTEPATPLPALSQQAELLVFNGQHFGNDANAVQVTYRGPTKNFTCTVQTVSNTEIQCLTQPSSNGETGLVFYISIGEQVVTGTDIYNYPSVPLVDSISVSGCTTCTNIKYTCGCPTSGLNSTGSPVTLTISGNKLSPPLEVFVAGKQCAEVSFSGTFPAAVVTCKLPTGAGFNQETVLAQSGLRASSKPFVSYAAPSVQSVSGCVDKKDCKRKSPTDAITITGTDFGFSGARAFVGGKMCNSTSHVNGTEYTRILCKMPEGFGLNLVISVYQLEGEISQETGVTVSYAQCLEGTYREGLNCPSCPKGSANNALDQLSCPLCLSGRFANASGMSNCLECPAGYFSGQNASACGVCPPGKFSDDSDPTCIPCDSGYATGSNNTAYSCPFCTAGRYAERTQQMRKTDDGPTECRPCEKGKYNNKDRSAGCLPCSAGRFKKEDSDQTSCNECTPGKYQPNETSTTECLACEKGKYNNEVRSTGCTRCSAGRFKKEDSNQTFCDECTPGKYQRNEQSTKCLPCEKGKYNNEARSTGCTPCSAGRFKKEDSNQTFCDECTPGKYQPHEQSTTECLPCEKGKYNNEVRSTGCTPCSAGRFKKEDSDQTSCDECTPGKYQPNETSTTECLPCEKGKYNNEVRSTGCTPCSAGRFKKEDSNQTFCDECTPGKYQLNEQSTTDCLPCEKGYFNNERGWSVKCTPCSVGKFKAQDSDQTFCDECPAGKYQPYEHNTTCFDCPPGTYSEQGDAECLPCASGYASPNANATSCGECTVGKYSLRTNLMITQHVGPSTCELCPEGRYSNKNRTTDCTDCPAGTFNNITGQTETGCKDCPVLFYSDGGAANCTPCTNTSNNIRCKEGCGMGFYRVGNDCIPCSPGTYQDEQNQQQCKVCGPGKYTDESGAKSCTDCPLGRARLSPVGTPRENATVCPLCKHGYYQDVKGQPTCKSCLPGFYIDSEGTTACKDCTRGYFSLLHSPECTECPGGKISKDDQASNCSECSPGNYSAPGSYTCSQCGAGFYSLGNVSECTPCPNGTSTGLNALGSTTCYGCASGEFALEGAPQCLKCDVGTYGGETASGSCETCLAGKYNAKTGTTGCVLCDVGTFSNESGLNECYKCPVGKFSSSLAATQCFDCEAGRITPEEGLRLCVACQKGSIPDEQQKSCISIYYQTETVINAFAIAAGSAGFLVVVTFLFFIWERDHREIRTAQPMFMFVTMLGFMVVNAAVVLIIIDQEPVYCILKYVFINLGVAVVLTSIVAKQWSVHKIFNQSADAALKPVTMNLSLLLLRITIPFFFLDVVILIIWHFSAPFSVIPKTGECISDWEPYVHIPLWGWKLLMLLFMAWLTYQVRDVDSRFNESRWLELIVYNWLLTIGLLLAIVYTMDLQPRVDFILLDAVILYLCISTWGMSFLPKFFRVYKEDHEYDDLFGSEVGSDISDAEEALQEEKAEEKEDIEDVKTIPGFDDPKIKKLIIKRHQKANELQKMLKIVERTKQRMKVDVQTLNALNSDVLALNSEIEYRKKLIAKGGGSAANENAYKAQQQPGDVNLAGAPGAVEATDEDNTMRPSEPITRRQNDSLVEGDSAAPAPTPEAGPGPGAVDDDEERL
eukprot:g38250.t1